MAHLGLICPELSGHLNPMTTLGRELKRRGQRVTLIGRPDAQKKTESAGLEFAVVGEKEFPVGALAKTFCAARPVGRLECAAIYRGTPAAWRGHNGRPSIGCDRENGC